MALLRFSKILSAESNRQFTSIDEPITKEAMNAVGSSVFITKESAETFPDCNAKMTASPQANDVVS